jgi:hypothetical protein
MNRHNEFVSNILEGVIWGKRPWKDLDYNTYSKSPETQQLTVAQQCKELLATNPDVKPSANKNTER